MLMANAPAPYANRDLYYGVQVTGSSTGTKNTAGEYLYNVTITNVGNKSILKTSSLTTVNNDSSETNSFGFGALANYVFKNWVIAPGASLSFSTPIYGPEITDFSALSWYGQAYNLEDPDVEFGELSLEKSSYGEYKLKGKISNLKDYYYTVILEVEYDQKDYAFEVAISEGSNRWVKTKGDLDLDKLIFKKATAYRSSYNTYKSKPSPYIYLFFAGVAVIILLISAAIIIPIIIVTTRKRHKNKNISK